MMSRNKGNRNEAAKEAFNEASNFELAEEVFGTAKMMAFLKVSIKSSIFFSVNDEYLYFVRNLLFVTP